MNEENSDAIRKEHEAATESNPTGRKEWAVLIYLGGENNLFDEMVFAVKEMKASVPKPTATRQGSNEFNFHALVQFAAAETSRPSSAYPQPRRFILKPGDDGLGGDYDKHEPSSGQSQEPSSSVEDYKDELIDFLLWGIHKAKANHYMVIFSGHGLGIESDFLTEDSTPPRSLTVKDLSDVLGDRAVKHALGERTIDILGLDSCLMAMAEVGYELREEVPIMIASQGSEANLGWPYKSIFARLHEGLKENGRLSPSDVAAIVMDEFVLYYDDFACAADSSADISAWHLRNGERYYMDELKAAVDSLAKQCLSIIWATKYDSGENKYKWDPASNEFAKSLIFAHWYAQTYHSDQYVDIHDFCDVLLNSLPAGDRYEAVKKSCNCVNNIVDTFTIRGTRPRRFSGPLYQYSYGVSIYLPWSEIYSLYNADNLDFLKYGEWYAFVKAYTEFTRRPPRTYTSTDKRLQEYETKDFPPHTKGGDDPSVRAKNPPSVWKVGEGYTCRFKEPFILE